MKTQNGRDHKAGSMNLTFICGSSISRKTEKIHEAVIRESIAHPEKQYILLVPEQASLITQQTLIDKHPDHALFNIDVLTFNRLSYRVFDEMKVSTKNVLSETGKLMLLKLIVSRHEDELSVLKRNAHRIGFLSELKSVISELSQYNVDEKTLEEEAEKVREPVLKRKLKDICVLYRAYLALLHESYALSEEKLSLLAAAVKNWTPVKDTVFVLDGYTGFTPPQYRVLDALIKCSAGVILGITLGSGETFAQNQEKDDLFYMSSHMKEEAEKLAEAHNVRAETVFVQEDGRIFSPEIRHIERNLFRYPKKPPLLEDEEAISAHVNVRIFRAKDRKEEIAAALSQILSAIREEETLPDGTKKRTYAYNDIAVILGDPEGFREELEAQFSEAGIPYFFDSPKCLTNDPLFLLVKGLPALLKYDFRFNEVFSLVKNPIVLRWLERELSKTIEKKEKETEDSRAAVKDLSPRERLLEVENYVVARGIRGKNAYAAEWQGRYHHFDPDRLPALNEAKDLLFAPFLTFAEDMKAANSVREKLFAIRTCLNTLQASEIMQELVGQAERKQADGQEEGKAADKQAKTLSENAAETLGREYESAPEYLDTLFEEIETILGDELLPDDEFADVLETGLANTTLRLAPPTKDRLVIGDLKRTRLGNVKKLFVLGANEGLLPYIGDGAGILTDRDREALEEQNLKLADTAKEETFFAHFYLYLLMTKPTAALTVFYSAAGEEGSLLLPSFAVSELLAVFQGETPLKPQRFGPPEELLNTRTSVYRTLAEELRTYQEEAGQGHFKEKAADETGQTEDAGAVEKSDTPEKKTKTDALKNLARHYAWAFRDDEARALRMIDSLFWHYENEKLDKALAVSLYGKELKGSVSRLETFAHCPYQHFLNYGIRLEEQQVFETDSRNIGTLFHDSVEAFFRITKEEERNWWALDNASRLDYVKKSVGRALEKEETGVFAGTARNRYLVSHVERVTDRSLKTLQHQWTSGGFEETEVEVPFESRRLKAFALPLESGVLLSLGGKIDRIDTAKDQGKVFVRIIDYKTGKNSLDYTKVYYGLQLQLLLYLKAAEERIRKSSPGKEVVPAGIYYYVLQDRPAEADGKDADFDPEEAILQNMRLEGVTNLEGDALRLTDREVADGAVSKASSVATRLKTKTDGKLDKRSVDGNLTGSALTGLSEFALSKAKKLSEEITGGEISVCPADKDRCKYCAYRKFCGFYAQIPGYRGKKLQKHSWQDLVREAEKEDTVLDPSGKEVRHD